jgi:hypothetical protein
MRDRSSIARHALCSFETARVIVVARANRPPADQWETLVSSSIPLPSHDISVVQRQALRTNVHSVANGSTELRRSVHSLPRVPWRTRLNERLGSASRTLVPNTQE